MHSLDFSQIVELLNAVYCLGQLLEFYAFLWLRYKYGRRGGTAGAPRRSAFGRRRCCAWPAPILNLPPHNPHRRYPSLHRPYRIPLSTRGCALLLLPACLLLWGLLLVPVFTVSCEWEGGGGCALARCLCQLACLPSLVPHAFKHPLSAPLFSYPAAGLGSHRLHLWHHARGRLPAPGPAGRAPPPLAAV